MIATKSSFSAFSQNSWPTGATQDEACWWVLRTKSRQEKAVATTLSAWDIKHFLPLITAQRFHGNRKINTELPLFPGYVFLHGNREDTFQIDRTRRLACILPVEDQQQLHRQLDNLRKAIYLEACFDPYPYLAHGVWAEVKSGPYQGIQGKVDRETSPNKLILQVDLLQSAMALELDGSLLSVL
jgi:transcription termination/antitermination protein NusG